jgi:coenzyme F420 biosynthesis associated uncharacterized protein
MLDWALAERIADVVAGASVPGGDGAAATAPLAADLPALASQAREAVVAYAELEPARPLPPLEVVDRPAWARANLKTMRSTLAPLVERMEQRTGTLAGPLRTAGGVVMAVEIGGLVGLMGRRVLGQYELALLDVQAPVRLLLVEPNLRDAARELDVDLGELLTWVVVHEVTHAVQFTAVDWLQEHLGGPAAGAAGLARRLRRSGGPAADAQARRPDRPVGPAARRRLVTAVAGPERRAVLDRVQAAMALVEGHAEHVMDAAGPAAAARSAGAAQGARPSPPRAPACDARARAPAGPRPEAAPVRGGAAVLRRGRAARGRRGAQPRLARSGAAADARRAGGSERLDRANARSSAPGLTAACNVGHGAGYKHAFGATLRTSVRTNKLRRGRLPMPETTTKRTASSTTRKTTARKSTARKPRTTAAAQRATARSPRAKTAATRRSTAGKRAATTRNARSAEANAKRAERKAERRAEGRLDEVRSYVEQVGDDVRTYVEQAGDVAERVVLTSVGAALVARDGVVELRETWATPAKARRELNRYERRGVAARNRVERDVKKARTRVERELRQRRTRFGRDAQQLRRDVRPLADQAGVAAARVENAVQEGLLAGSKVANRVTEQAVRVA